MSDNSIFPEFFVEAVQHDARTEEEGRPIFEERELVRIRIAGDSKSVVVRKVNAEVINRWPEHYKAFKNNMEAPLDGTPLSEWPLLTVSRIKELQALNIKTVEALAELRDSALGRVGMGGRELQNQAIAFIESAKDAGHATRLAAELTKRDDTIEMMGKQIEELSDAMDALKAGGDETPKRKPGRPKKAAAA